MKRLLMPLLILLLAACASQQPAATQAATDDKGTICERQTPTGSLMPTTRCTTAAEREEARRSVNNVSENVRNQRAAQGGKAGS
ncbi:uncharacterized protein YcfL [Pelomonas saccharophila]|uniref:Uncharacterized protein YcfL n=1 Tax=Roseateles saccharophilus TaxID=304 RepID=A0ABU1YUY0_ROSSA|nr:hypothetical protein [Roseateles saccharophilus]MDR7272679.1 uncharacterized protein YcfL [Roseateles saccharophilus]